MNTMELDLGPAMMCGYLHCTNHAPPLRAFCSDECNHAELLRGIELANERDAYFENEPILKPRCYHCNILHLEAGNFCCKVCEVNWHHDQVVIY